MKLTTLNKQLLKFLDSSPTAFHACANIEAALLNAGFDKLVETESWNIKASKSYFVTRNDSSIIAFRMPKAPTTNGFRMVGAHTDSPCLKLKPNSLYQSHGYWQLGVEVYGGVLLNPWFDRDLSLAGRVTMKRRDGGLWNTLVDFQDPIAIIPSLAIHLDREANKSRSINAQTYIPPILALAEKSLTLEDLLIKQLQADGHDKKDINIIDYELALYPTEKASKVGLNQEFIASARLDNLLSCFTACRSIADTSATTNQLIVCNDHEEVGSGSSSGARGTFLQDVLNRLMPTDEERIQSIAKSMLISTDNAHGVHPNFADKHDSRHGPLLNAGPVIKVNSNQAYATNSETAALFKLAAKAADVSTQSFVTRTDMGCGSTIGPLTATAIGVRTVDVGVPTFAMHSIRELAGSEDAHSLYRALRAFYEMDELSTG